MVFLINSEARIKQRQKYILLQKELEELIKTEFGQLIKNESKKKFEKKPKRSKNWIKLDKPEPMCLIMMNIAGHPVHIGLCLDETYMIHTLRGHNSAIEKHNSIKWKRRIEGFYKWPFM